MKKRTTCLYALFFLILTFLVNCTTMEPIVANKPNLPYQGNYPLGFLELRRQNPLLAEELGKLPEIQDGISKTDSKVLNDIVLLYKSNPKSFDLSFEEMYKVGIPAIRKFNTPLQGLFWIVEKGGISNARNIVANSDLETLLVYQATIAWNIDSKEWDNFEIVADRLNSPELLLLWMKKKGRITYGWPGYPDHSRWIVRSPKEVFKAKNGECIAQSLFEKTILNRNGYKGALLFVDRKGASDHGVYYWKKGDKYFYLEHSFESFKGIYGPFNDISEIGSHVFEHLVRMDGKRSQRIFSSFDNVRPGDSWNAFLRKTTFRKTKNWN